MSCTTGDRSCDVPRRRGALLVLGFMAVLFVLLSYFSFVEDRGQATPDEYTYKEFTADEGKRVFQAYNCMGCHTIVGNGGYFGPDLTQTYALTGPAWLEAFLPSAGQWPTEAALRTRLNTPEQLAQAGVTSFDEYLDKYPGVADRIGRRGGQRTDMPNLPFSQDEVGKLIAFFAYTSGINTEGWPPVIQTGDLDARLSLARGRSAAAASVSTQAASGAAPQAEVADVDPAVRGEQLITDYGCLACHTTDTTRTVGPGWGGLYGHEVKFTDGSSLTADEAYLAESILAPEARIVEGYPPGLMPPYEGLLSQDEVDAMVAYLVSLGEVQ